MWRIRRKLAPHNLTSYDFIKKVPHIIAGFFLLDIIEIL